MLMSGAMKTSDAQEKMSREFPSPEVISRILLVPPSPSPLRLLVERFASQMYQAVLWENMVGFAKAGKGLCFGCNQHVHYIDNPVPRVHRSGLDSYSGSKMVHSELAEMLANVRACAVLHA